MSDIFLSYSREDVAAAERIASALESHGWNVWWDRSVPAGRDFDEVIEEALDASACVVVLWSHASVSSRWVRTEAQEGLDRDALVPVLISDVTIPLAFRRVQAATLIGWDGQAEAPRFRRLLADIETLAGPPIGSHPVARRSGSSSGATRRGNSAAPQPHAPQAKRQFKTIAAAAILGAATVAAFGYGGTYLQQRAATLDAIELAHASMGIFHREISQNRARLADVTPAQLIVLDTLEALLRSSDIPNDLSALMSGLPLPSLLSTAWLTAETTGALANVDFELVSALTLTYSIQDAFSRWLSESSQPIARTDARRESLSRGDLNQAQRYVSDLVARESELTTVFDQMLELLCAELATDVPEPSDTGGFCDV